MRLETIRFNRLWVLSWRVWVVQRTSNWWPYGNWPPLTLIGSYCCCLTAADIDWQPGCWLTAANVIWQPLTLFEGRWYSNMFISLLTRNRKLTPLWLDRGSSRHASDVYGGVNSMFLSPQCSHSVPGGPGVGALANSPLISLSNTCYRFPGGNEF